MKKLFEFSIFCVLFLLISCIQINVLNDGRTKVPKDLNKIKKEYQTIKYFPFNSEIYELQYNITGIADFQIIENTKPWNYNDSYKKYLKFYENGNVNFFYIQNIDEKSFDPSFHGDRGFYYFLDDKNFIVKIFVQTDEWGGKSFVDYFGKIDGKKILLSQKRKYAGTKTYLIEVFEKSKLNIKKYESEW